MSKAKKLLDKILSGLSDSNISFDDLCKLLLILDFEMRIKGSHYIFTKSGIAEIINLQEKNSKAKPYQVKQVRELILTYKLGVTNDL